MPVCCKKKEARLSQRCDVMLSSRWVPSPRCEERAWSAWHGSIWLCHTAFVLLWAPQRRAKGTEAKGKSLCDRRCCDEGPGRLLTLSTWSVFLGSGKIFASTSGPTLTLVCQDGPSESLQLEGDLRGPFPKGRHPAQHFSWRLLSWVMGGSCLPPSHPANSLLVILLSPFSRLFLGWGCPARLVLL